MMLSYLIPQKWYVILQEEGAEVFIYQWRSLKERYYFKTPVQLMEKISLNCPAEITILIDHESEILASGLLPKSSFLDQKLLLENHLRTQFPSESWFGGMYLKTHQKGRPFLGVSFQASKAIKAWLVPLKAKKIRIHLTFFVIEAQNFLRQKLDKIEQSTSFILLMFWHNSLKQMLFLQGEIRHLRTIKQPSSLEEFNNQLTSFSHYVRRQHHLSAGDLSLIYVKALEAQKIPEDMKEAIEIKDLTKDVISYIKTHRLSRFRMLQGPELGMSSYKRFVYKYTLYCLFSLAMLGIISVTKNFWIFQKRENLSQKISQRVPSQKSLRSPLALYLAAIFYLDEKTWTLWLNGRKITTPQGVKEFGYEIIHVTEHQITLKEINSNNSIILKPNQTFIVQQKCIKVGDWQARNNKNIKKIRIFDFK